MKMLKTIFYRSAGSLLVAMACWASTCHGETVAGPSAFFKLGEMYGAVRVFSYFTALGDKIDARFKEMAELAKSLGAPQAVLDNIESVHKVNAALPYTKSWNDWTPEQQKMWKDPSSAFAEDPWRNWLVVKPYDNALFWYLGRYSFDAWYEVQAGIQNRGQTISSMLPSITSYVESAQTLSTDANYLHGVSLLTPEALTALKAMASIKDKVDDPLSAGVTMDDVNILGNAGKTLHDLNSQGKLVK